MRDNEGEWVGGTNLVGVRVNDAHNALGVTCEHIFSVRAIASSEPKGSLLVLLQLP